MIQLYFLFFDFLFYYFSVSVENNHINFLISLLEHYHKKYLKEIDQIKLFDCKFYDKEFKLNVFDMTKCIFF